MAWCCSDERVAERDVVLTYAPRALLNAGVMAYLALWRLPLEIVFGSPGRFSEELDSRRPFAHGIAVEERS